MPFTLKIHSLAYLENIKAYQWYELQQKGLGAKYLTAVEKSIDRILNSPEYFSLLRGKYRHLKVKGFPYTIVYEFSQHRNIVHISAIFHSSRHPNRKFRKEE